MKKVAASLVHISIRILVYLAVFAGLLFLYVRHLESKSIFFPSKVIEAIPSEFNLAFDDVYLLTADSVKIHGWFIPYDGAKYTLLFCHGNGGNISNRFDKIFFFRQLKLNILIIDYHGYGKSSGKP
ncbi:MAG: alpha/beta hydrolase, partial [Omnitrophica bacterium]|nr:alpha/beta hydrolase [Candidatus Omnitrophota bacterium]